MEKKENEFLAVPPFECAWREDLKFLEPGRGCVVFEALAHNDVTLVFRENVGSQRYHYKRDNSPHYTVILGSHRNKRLRIEVDGKTVVDIEGIGLCSSSFQSYWISVYDGLISIGRGKYPFHNLVFRWLDQDPKFRVRYVGLSSWDKHVGYRNVNVFPISHEHEEGSEDFLEKWGLENFLESWDLSGVSFVLGGDGKYVPAHKAILALAGNFPLSSPEIVLDTKGSLYSVLCSLLKYIYTGRTQVLESNLSSLMELSQQFEVMPLVKQCEEVIEELNLNKDSLFDSVNSVELSYPIPSTSPQCYRTFPFGLPVDKHQLKQFQLTGDHSDVSVYIEGHGLVSRSHKIILSLWSIPFAKMFTNGMRETYSSEVLLRDVSKETFEAMLDFMYSGELSPQIAVESGDLLLRLLLLADQFGVTLLHHECCKTILECLSEDTVCPILEAVSSVWSCKLIEETCERNFAMHFDYCTTASSDFVYLDETNFGNIIRHPDLTLTFEEKVLDAILMWGTKAKEVHEWTVFDELMTHSTPEIVFGERLQSVYSFLSLVRFPVMQISLLKKLEKSNISMHMSAFNCLVKEAIDFNEGRLTGPEYEQNERFQHRRSSYKELQYICDGDSNGVLYYAGTSYGEHQWFNPILAKTITITASSPPSRFTDPKVLASRTYQGTSFAGPRMTDGHTSTWWTVDIGSDHQLMCNYYTLRQDGSRVYMRYWNLQGSLDGITWTDLSIHENDQTVCKPGQFASWPIIGPNALRPYRFFRVILTGPTTDFSNRNNLCICFLELYGYFHRNSEPLH